MKLKRFEYQLLEALFLYEQIGQRENNSSHKRLIFNIFRK